MTTKTVYRKFTHPGDPQLRCRIPRELFEQLKLEATYNRRDLNAELIARLTITLQHKNLMDSDRLMRLIYCKHLAYQNVDL